MLKGGESGKPAVVAGDPDKSLLIEAIRYRNEDLRMPPKGERLTDAQVRDFEAWVRMGAPDPRVATAVAATPPADPKAFWSFQPPRAPAGGLDSVDAFIHAKLAAAGLSPSPPADRRTLIRRAAYDLHGLPPTPEEVDAFVADEQPDAYERLIDRLLASPRYGERWGRYWLDLARYSDTKGYVFGREERQFVHAWAYRDWVIRAFNEDLPYDQFLLKQIAADQLPPRDGAVTHGVDQDLAAMGFLTGGRRFLGVIHDIIDDRIDVVLRTTQGLTVACARCHDHKFDPIPQADYYSLYGVFAAASERMVCLDPSPPRTPEYVAYEAELRKRTEKFESTFRARREEAADHFRRQSTMYFAAQLDVEKLPLELFGTQLTPEDLNPVIARQWQSYLYRSSQRPFDPIFAPWHALAALPKEQFAARAPDVIRTLREDVARPLNRLVAEALAANPPTSMADLAKLYGKLLDDADRAWREDSKKGQETALRLAALAQDREALRQVLYGADSPCNLPPGSVTELELFFDEPRREELFKLQGEIDRWNIAAAAAPPQALVLADRDGPLPNPRVFKRGNAATKGEEVPRRFLKVLSGANREPFRTGSGRLEMAKAIAGRDNPLTARVMVNRIWQHHFGEGLVRTPSDFGARGDRPTHPELLDWLAVRFMQDGWSVKRMHRLIMLSDSYRQSSLDRADGAAADPENRLLWRQNRERLDFESMRDSLLAVTGELDVAATGGRPVELFKPGSSRRRTVYGLVDRQYLPGVFRVFDFANPDLHIPQRPDTTVPQQALFFMNHPFVFDRVRALVKRPEVAQAGDPSERVRRLYRLVYQRDPTPAQVEAAIRFVADAEREPTAEPVKAVPAEWRYGFGEFDEASQKMKSFTPLPHFTGDAWQGGPAWPDGALGWVRVTADGGHAGNDLAHAAVRRWVAPRDMSVVIAGTIRHEHKEGDGIRCRIVSNRQGQLASYILHDQAADVRFEPVAVKRGDTIDFAVDICGMLTHDEFAWSPTIKSLDAPAAPKRKSPDAGSEVTEWDARRDFGGTPTEAATPLTPWERYAQVLLLANEFMFVD